MIKELNLNSPYKVYKNLSDNIYFFDTESKIRYIAYFTDADEYFNDNYLKNNIFSFGFEPQNQSVTYKNLFDSKIKLTIVAILKNFFLNQNNVLTFVTDISDLRQKARSRLFEIWKNEFDLNDDFDKFDLEIISEDETYYSSMIVHKNNINREKYKESFLKSVNDLSK